MQVELSDRDLAQVRAALRNWRVDGLNEDLASIFERDFSEHGAMTDDEVVDLCERLETAY